MNRFVLKNTFIKVCIYHFLINIFIKKRVEVRLWRPCRCPKRHSSLPLPPPRALALAKPTTTRSLYIHQRPPPNPNHLPPGPRGHQMVGALTHRSLRELQARRHGPVMLGSVPTVVVSRRGGGGEGGTVMKVHDVHADCCSRPNAVVGRLGLLPQRRRPAGLLRPRLRPAARPCSGSLLREDHASTGTSTRPARRHASWTQGRAGLRRRMASTTRMEELEPDKGSTMASTSPGRISSCCPSFGAGCPGLAHHGSCYARQPSTGSSDPGGRGSGGLT